MQHTTAHAERSWFRQGLVFGLLVGLIQILGWFITMALPGMLLHVGMDILFVPLLSLVGGLLVSVRLSRQTGKMGAGLLAALVAVVVADLVFFLASTVYVTIELYQMGHAVNPLIFFLSSAVLFFVVQRLLTVVLFGLIGGVIGVAVGREEHVRV